MYLHEESGRAVGVLIWLCRKNDVRTTVTTTAHAAHTADTTADISIAWLRVLRPKISI